MNATHHKEHLLDRVIMLMFRTLLATQPKAKLGPAGRADFDTLMKRTKRAESVTFGAASINGVSGWWCRPADALKGCAVLYLHGGAYVQGSAAAYRNFCSQIATRAGAAVFVAEYALAPEQPFPKAVEDAEAVYKGLVEEGYTKLAVAGDSAGGGLALSVLQFATASSFKGDLPKPAAGAVFSPWADLALTGQSLSSRARHDPLLSREMLDEAAALYLDGNDHKDPKASPLFGDFTGFPPTLIHVGKDEVLLDDATRIAERIELAGGAVQLNIWKGMAHVFVSNLQLQAAREALDQTGTFLREKFETT